MACYLNTLVTLTLAQAGSNFIFETSTISINVEMGRLCLNSLGIASWLA